MEKILKKFTYTVMAIAILFITLISFVCGGVGASYAATSNSEVLADLRKDPDFDESAYPYVKDDYGLHVIQIAESSNKELFVYAYQPCHDTYDLKGTKISISYGYSLNGTDLSPRLYNLRLVSTSGTLDKYYVEDFTVPNDGDRYYNIVEIFRMINTEIDGEQDETNPKTDKAYPVGQQWYVCDLNDSKHYEMNTFKTMQVETVHTGSVIFNSGIKWGNIVGKFDYCNAWFHCFKVDDYVINHIFNADLSYRIRKAHISAYYEGVEIKYTDVIYDDGDGERLTTYLKDIDKMSYKGDGLFGDSFEWNRILSAVDFVSTVEKQGGTVPDDLKTKLLPHKDENGIVVNQNIWVLTFLETERHITPDSYPVVSEYFSDIDEVGVLNLHFQDARGDYYDLGVVNDLTDPDNISEIYGFNGLLSAFENFWDMFVKIILALVGIALIALLINYAGPVKVVLQYICKGIEFLVCLPFKLIKLLFKRDG